MASTTPETYAQKVDVTGLDISMGDAFRIVFKLLFASVILGIPIGIVVGFFVMLFGGV